jgi:hypothetical protein
VIFSLGRRRLLKIVSRQQGGEKRLYAKVIVLQDFVELMVVALGTAHRQPHKDRRRGGRDIVQDFLAALFEIGRVVFVWIQTVQAGGDQCPRITGFQFVAGELLADETIVGKVVVESGDDVVAVLIGVRPVVVCLETIGFGIAHKV